MDGIEQFGNIPYRELVARFVHSVNAHLLLWLEFLFEQRVFEHEYRKQNYLEEGCWFIPSYCMLLTGGGEANGIQALP